MVNAEETLWECDNIEMENVIAKGNYFAMNSKNIRIDGFASVSTICEQNSITCIAPTKVFNLAGHQRQLIYYGLTVKTFVRHLIS